MPNQEGPELVEELLKTTFSGRHEDAPKHQQHMGNGNVASGSANARKGLISELLQKRAAFCLAVVSRSRACSVLIAVRDTCAVCGGTLLHDPSDKAPVLHGMLP